MRSNIRNLIIVAVCIVVLGGALLTLKLTGNDKAASSSASSTASIELVSKKSEDVVSMNVVNEKGSYTLIPVKTPAASGASSASSGDSGPAYTVKELGGCPINTSATESVVKNGFSLVASKNLGTVSNLEEFGLKDPQATVKVQFRDGSSYDYKIGKTSATDSSAYYMCGLNSENVYIVSVDQGLLEDAGYFVSKDILAITNSSGENNFTKIALSGANYPQPVAFSVYKTDLRISSPSAYTADSTKLSSLKSALASLTADSVEAVNPDAAALKKYGFDSPTAVAQFSVNGANYTITAGAKDGDGYYVMLGGINVVYKAASSGIEAWALQSLYDLRSKTILAPDVETVKSLTVTVGSSKNVLNLTRAKDEKQSTEDTTYYTYKVTGNAGKSLDYDTNYKNFFTKLTGVSILQEASEKPAGSPVLTVQYQYFDGSSADTVEFYQSGNRRYTAVLNGQVFGIVAQDDIDAVTEDIAALENGKAVG
ncbi:DUF4340 domain-containing protein [Caproiciproducens sp. NJN-50]|uniref:DUF4340 domain-containing protein n=1 Tax=Acutalibacteraceae TaxID=3082771 RepID=UPI000FFDFD7D|nr:MULTISPECIES: DUF4340 domain-containing protein [Acutalibacteraceae]QAT48299.1 DUF4340 domain-containing protein [Caproiciproducens sp. NJN-50]